MLAVLPSVMGDLAIRALCEMTGWPLRILPARHPVASPRASLPLTAGSEPPPGVCRHACCVHCSVLCAVPASVHVLGPCMDREPVSEGRSVVPAGGEGFGHHITVGTAIPALTCSPGGLTCF